MGRPTKLTKELADEYCQRVEDGYGDVAAAELCAVTAAAVLQWIQRGEGRHPTRKPAKVYVEFVGMVKKAREKREQTKKDLALDAIRRAHTDPIVEVTRKIEDGVETITEKTKPAQSWQSAAWYLERVYPDEYAARERRDGGTRGDDLPDLTDEEKNIVDQI